MRIVGGKFGGRKLAEFISGGLIRPTSDNAREALFNILREKIEGSNFLDLFSGTGAVGIEAISRGAKSVTFNDYSRESIALIKKNLSSLKTEADVSNYDALTFIDRCKDKFDVIYIDAPYQSDIGIKSLKKISFLLNEDGVAIYENEKSFTEQIEEMSKVDERKYGRAFLTFFKKKSDINCVFSGTFDPITKGHENIIEKCLNIYKNVFIVLGENSDKTPLFSREERINFIKEIYKNNERVKIFCYFDIKERYSKTLKEWGVFDHVRGIRNDTDKAYEEKYAKINAKLYPFINTVFISPDKEYVDISSSAVKEKILKGEDISSFVSPCVLKLKK